MVKHKTHCKHGHEYTGSNIYIAPKTGARGCRLCRNKYADSDTIHYVFGGNREKVIIRDGEKCLMCGMTREEHKLRFKRDITVDHIDGMGSGVPTSLKNNAMDNLQTLCLSCHANKDNIYKRLSDNDVANILHLKGSITAKEIAKMYGVATDYVHQLQRGAWRKSITK